MSILQDLQNLLKEAQNQIQQCQNEVMLSEIETNFLGRKSPLNNFARAIGQASPEERPQLGQAINKVKNQISLDINDKRQVFWQNYLQDIADKEWLDPSLEVESDIKRGHRHPLSSFIEEISSVFTRLGFSEVDGPEIDNQWFNFTALNVAADHPAREMQDTFFVENYKSDDYPNSGDQRDSGMVLRTQTSGMQIHYMLDHKPPLRIFAPGKVYRKDSDATHSPVFHQVEGLLIDRNVSMADLKGTLTLALSELLNIPDLEILFRLSYFPFTEPSLEMDIKFPLPGKPDKLLEIGGAGMVHPQVLRNCNIDPNEFQGFAFGLGIERLIMIRNNITDIRLFYENDTRFLSQF